VFLLQQPVIVRVVEQPVPQTSLGDVIIGALATVVMLLLIAALLGGVLGGMLILTKIVRTRFGWRPYSDHEDLHITPTP
jgi:hypothetical protein